MLDAKVASASKGIISSQYFRRRVKVTEQRAQKNDRFLWGRQIVNMIYKHFRATGAHDAAQGLSDLFNVSLQGDDSQDFVLRWDRALLSASEAPKENVLESLYKMKTRESVQLQHVLAMYEQEIDRDRSMSRRSKIEDYCKKTYWSDDQVAQLLSPEWKDGDRSISQKSQREECQRGKENGRLLSVGKETDSVQEETLAASATGVIGDNEHNRHLVLQRRRHRLTEESPRKALAPGENVLLEGKVRQLAKITSKEFLRIRHVILGILPYVKITNLKRDANLATNVCSDTLRLNGSPIKSRRKVVEKDQWPYWRSLHCWVVSQDCFSRNSILRAHGKLGSNRTVKFSNDTWHHLKDREGTGPSQGMMQTCEPQERSPCEPKFEDRTVQETLQQERCARREAWDLAKHVQKLKNKGQGHVLLPNPSVGNASTLCAKVRGTRIRGGFWSVNAHAEQKGFKLRRTGNHSEVQEHHNGGNCQLGSANMWESTGICSRSWSLRDSAITRRNAWCSIAFQTLRWTRIFLWVGQRSKATTNKTRMKILCKTENCVPLVVPGLSSNSCTSSSSTSLPQDSSSTSSSPATERTDDGSPGNWHDSLKKPIN